MHSWYFAFAIGAATLLLALAAQVATAQAQPVVQRTPAALVQSERDAVLTGSDVLASRLPSVHPQASEHRTQERLLVDGEIAIEHVGTPATPGWGMEQPQLLGGLAIGLLGLVLVVLRPRSPRSPAARRRQLLQGLRAWLTSQTAGAER